MSRGNIQARLRTPKASERQKKELLGYFEKNPSSLRIINGYCNDNKAKQKIWIELAHRLNSLDGALKTSSKWAKYWHDIIIYTKHRARSAITGEARGERPPTEIEKRILLIVGQLSLLKLWERSLENTHDQETIKKDSSNITDGVDDHIHGSGEGVDDEIQTIDQQQLMSDDEISLEMIQEQEEELPSHDTDNCQLGNCETVENCINATTTYSGHQSEYESSIDINSHNSESAEPEHKIKFNNVKKHESSSSEQFLNKSLTNELSSSLKMMASGFRAISDALVNIASIVEKINPNEEDS